VGDFTGRGNPALTGTDIGTPLLFDLFDVLDYRSAAGWFARPASLELRPICTESGLPPDTSCHATGEAWYRPGVSEARLCDHQRVVWTAADGRRSYCPACLPTDPARAGARPTLWPNFAPELAAWLALEHLPVRTPPPHNPACAVVTANDDAVDRAPRILAPASQTEIAFDPEDPTAQVLLQCAPDPAVRRVYWYVNDRLLRAAGPNERVFCRPPRGWVKISCADDQGRNRNHWVRVL
jgi:penicillin-binding protein 1C